MKIIGFPRLFPMDLLVKNTVARSTEKTQKKPVSPADTKKRDTVKKTKK